jgi:hypothetical protein
MTLHGLLMYVSATGERGVVSSETRIHFIQKGSRVLGRYAGGAVGRGYLIGQLSGAELRFRYAQREASGEVHAGRSTCEVMLRGDGSVRIVEHFRWSTREGSGTNVFDELVVRTSG